MRMFLRVPCNYSREDEFLWSVVITHNNLYKIHDSAARVFGRDRIILESGMFKELKRKE